MLVLLIIFMVTAPLMTSGVSVDLPKTDAQAAQHRQPAVDRFDQGGRRRSSCRTRRCELPELVSKLQAIAQNNPDRRIFVRGDKDLAYGRIMEVMGTITQGGFTKVALLAEQPQYAAGRCARQSSCQRRPPEGRLRVARAATRPAWGRSPG